MEGKLMRTVQYNGYGGGASALKHVEVPVPRPGKDEMLLKVEAASINPIDWKIQSGMLRPLFPRKFPMIPGGDVAGEVVEVGEGIKNFKPGDKVITVLNPTSGGAMAEYCVCKETLVVLRPPEVSTAKGAALPGAGLTALTVITETVGIKLDGKGPQKNILITAASGGVGLYAVQIAKMGNAHVTATCGARNIDLVRSLGADEVLDYKTPEGAALKSPSGKKYDAVIHCATATPWSVFEPNLSPNGKVFDLTPKFAAFCTVALQKITFSKKQLVPYFLAIKPENLQSVIELAKDGKLKTVIDCEVPLSKAEDGWDKSMSGHATGKIIVKP
ncbi:chloroplast envelope quinone oxidoreductase homolog [Andrographis paniculata]|uniref:chloroplast envelope quinone oxidoreductase homolog n=1 Tax=Andrographis paniculata TaxID=175694 RepID=UPI0021E88D17|nr:chloroplast envelope quinone oxidoreductase homolog [Andrographis paniculata]